MTAQSLPVTLIAPSPPHGLSFVLHPSLVPLPHFVPVGKLRPRGTTPHELIGRAKPWVSIHRLCSLGAEQRGAFPGNAIPTHPPHTNSDMLVLWPFSESTRHPVALLRVNASPLPGDMCLFKGLSPLTQWGAAEWVVGATEVCFLSTAFGFLQGLRDTQCTLKAPSAVTQIPQGSQDPLACVAILKGFPPSPSQELPPRHQKTKTKRFWSE